MINLYGKKKELLPHFEVEKHFKNGNSTRFYITKKINKDKFEVPVNYSLETKLRWLEGYVDADGCVNLSKDATSIQVSSIQRHFLQDVQLMLTTIGINSNLKLAQADRKALLPKNDGTGEYGIYDCKTIYVLYITSAAVNQLINLGFEPKRLKLSNRERGDFAKQEKLLRVQKITKVADDKKTYCFNEPKNHTGIFNGILTGQSEVYSLLIETYVKDPKRKQELFDAVQTIPCVKEKSDWAQKWMDPKEAPFAQRLLAFAVVEGVFFSGSFCAIFWLKSKGEMCSTLGTSNEFIAKDEGMHTDFAVLLYSKLKYPLSPERVEEIFREAVEIETRFICSALPCRLIGMNSDLMTQYIKFVADRLLTQLGYKKIYKTTNPFDFMEIIGLQGKTNFFEKRVTEYQSASHLKDNTGDAFELDEDF